MLAVRLPIAFASWGAVMSGVVSVDHVAAPTMMSDGYLHRPFTEIDQALIDRLIERYVDASDQATEKVDAGPVSAFGSAL
jgi:hypothetical protein